MKKELIIIGAGNVGGFLSYNIREFQEEYNIIGFLDDDPEKKGKTIYGRRVLGAISEITSYTNKRIAVVIGIADPLIKQRIANKLSDLSLEFPSFVSQNAWLSQHVSLGKGVIIYPGVAINYETSIGDFVIVNMNCAIGHNCKISSFSTLAPGVNLAGYTFVERAVNIGIGVSTRQHIRIGSNSIIGGQTMLIRDVTAHSKIVGVPGSPLQ